MIWGDIFPRRAYRWPAGTWKNPQNHSVQFSCSVVSDSLRPHELQHARPPCLSPTPGVHSDSRPSSQWSIQPSHPLLSPLLLPQNPPSIRVFSNESTLRMRWPKYWSFRFSFSPSNEYSGLIYLGILGLTGLISLLFQESSPAPQFDSINSLVLSLLDGPTLTFIHDYQKNHTLTIWTFVGKAMSLLFNILSRFIMTFLPRSIF